MTKKITDDQGNGKSPNSPPDRLVVEGATAPSGVLYVGVSQGPKRVWLPVPELMANPSILMSRLAQADIAVVGPAAKRRLDGALDGVNAYPPLSLLEQPGWTGCLFALPNGRVFAPQRAEVGHVAFQTHPARCQSAGTLEGWLAEVAGPLATQKLASFVLMLGFVGPLLDLFDSETNQGFEVVGIKGKGKSTLAYLLASVSGRPFKGPRGSSVISWNSTPEGLGTLMSSFSGQTMVLEEAVLFYGSLSAAARADKVRDIVFRMADGQDKNTYHNPGLFGSKFVFFSGSNRPLSRVLAGHDVETAEAAADRLITLSLGSTRPHGVFDDELPDGFGDSGALARHLKAARARHHGVALPAFLRALVTARGEDEAALRARVAELMAAFRKSVGVNPNDGSAARVADAFGAAFAAGMLAKSFGALPKDFKPKAAARAAYHLYKGEDYRNRKSPRDRIRALARRGTVIDLDTTAEGRGKLKYRKGATGFLRRNRKTKIRELIVRKQKFLAFFKDAKALVPELRATGDMISDAGRDDTKREITSGQPERVFCFRMPNKLKRSAL